MTQRPAPPLRLRLLGTPGVSRVGEGTGAPVQRQALALLAVLACAGERGIARDKLLTLLWPESPASPAAHRLSQLLHWTRRTLGAAGLITGTTELGLEPGAIACDLWDFEGARRAGELERAAELYAGPFLDGFYLAGSGEFERWADSRRSELAREYQETLEALAVQAEARGDSLAASEWWGRLARDEPLSSRVTMHLMTALAAAGERARALAQANAYQKQVRTELEAEPNPAVVALARLLKREAPAGMAIGILPLVGVGDDAVARAIADGLTEELMAALAEIPGIRVAARTAITTAQQMTPDLRELGKLLGLTAMLEGTVRIAGGRLRLVVRLLDVADGCQRWTERWERDAGEVVAREEALARDVSARIGERLASSASSGASAAPAADKVTVIRACARKQEPSTASPRRRTSARDTGKASPCAARESSRTWGAARGPLRCSRSTAVAFAGSRVSPFSTMGAVSRAGTRLVPLAGAHARAGSVSSSAVPFGTWRGAAAALSVVVAVVGAELGGVAVRGFGAGAGAGRLVVLGAGLSASVAVGSSGALAGGAGAVVTT